MEGFAMWYNRRWLADLAIAYLHAGFMLYLIPLGQRGRRDGRFCEIKACTAIPIVSADDVWIAFLSRCLCTYYCAILM
ncbi:hypothetical protein BDZ91DRAFT_446916 [Kalaharituber pfeilii]|nr:hypothetical protein BDZ91DRAFT_446916 [Kalaharituber pfeilii]